MQGRIAGRVTSIQESPTLGHAIGLALVDPAIASRSDFRIRIDGGAELTATVTPLPFYDAAGERQTLDDVAEARAERIGNT